MLPYVEYEAPGKVLVFTLLLAMITMENVVTDSDNTTFEAAGIGYRKLDTFAGPSILTKKDLIQVWTIDKLVQVELSTLGNTITTAVLAKLQHA